MKNLWQNIAVLILGYKKTALIVSLLMVAMLGWQASQVKLAYEMAKILPQSDPNFQLYEGFKKRYGEDGNVMVAAIDAPDLFTPKRFNQWYALTTDCKAISGIKEALSCATIYEVVRNDSTQKFDFRPVLTKAPSTQAETDSLRAKINKLPFYKGFIISEDGRTHLLALTLDQKVLNSKSRLEIVAKVVERMERFEKETGIVVHLSGMPYIRTQIMQTVVKEMVFMMGLAVLITGLILFLFFRNFKAVFFPLIVVLLGVVMSLGVLVAMGYRITMLLGLIPPLIIIIGVPNCIFLLNRYYEEYAKHRNQEKALAIAIEKVGQTTFFANITTAIGFGVFVLTGSIMLSEFGAVAAIGVLLTYIVSMVFIPIVFSYLPPPEVRHLTRLENRSSKGLLKRIEKLVMERRTLIYTTVSVVLVISCVGISRLRAIGYVVDELPKDSPILLDMKFLDARFKGIIPFEVNIDTQQPNGVMNPQVLTKIRRMEKLFTQYPEFTEPVSIVRAVKFFYQGYRGGDPRFFVLPPVNELNAMQSYQTNLSKGKNRYASFLDSTRRFTRVSFQMPDVGTVRVSELIAELQPKIDTIFNQNSTTHQKIDPEAEGYEAKITGTSAVFAFGNNYLQKNLIESTLFAIVLICLLMWGLFLQPRMMFIATVPSLIPLLLTAGLMGFLGIPLKPSTILIFSIAFGISSDGSLYFLTRYRDELRNQRLTLPQAVSLTIRHTGVSMFYTAIILFCGFFIFVSSSFGGTRSMGILVSITLLVAMLSNLILLPAFLMTLDSREKKVA